jgi:hypothetical protein
MAFNPYNQNLYLQDLQNMRDRIDRTMQNYQNQTQQQAPITQNFQIAPQTNPSELQSGYANNIDEVRNIFMTKNGMFVNKDLTILWFKNTEGNIRTFTLAEVIEKDAKDVKIEELEKQIEEMKSLIQTEAKKKAKKEVE